MQKKSSSLLMFLFVLVISIGIFFLFRTGKLSIVVSAVNFPLIPIQKTIIATFHLPQRLQESPELKHLRDENSSLRVQLVHQKEIEKENNALQDQFQTTTLPTTSLIVATIIGMPGLIPGISLPDHLILDKGSSDGIHVGDAVVYKENVIGTVTQATALTSQVALLYTPATSFTAEDEQTGALGIVKGQQDSFTMESVLLSDHLHLNDVILTKGNVQLSGHGYPPGLIVGRITGVEKKSSALFQKATIKSFIDISRLSTVFILTKNNP